MRNKIHTILAFSVLIIMGLLIIYGIYSLTWPFNPIDFHTDKLHLSKGIFQQGEVIPISFKFDKYVDGQVLVHRKFKNEIVFPLSEIKLSRNKGKYEFVSYLTKVPDQLPPGKYILEYSFIYDINPLRTVTKTISTEEFTVIPSKRKDIK